jgi:hypothetical protein
VQPLGLEILNAALGVPARLTLATCGRF